MSDHPRTAASTPTHLRIESGDVVLAADAFGDPADPAVGLFHGGGQTRHSWGSTAADLGAAGWHAITVDVRGHGDSTWSPTGDYTLDSYSSDVRAVIDHLGRPAVLIGASLGGNAALEAIGRWPELALGLVLVDVSPFLQPEGAHRIREFMMARADEGFASLEEVADAISLYLPHRPRPNSLEGLRRNVRERDGRLYWHWDPAMFRSDRDEAVQRDRLVDPARLGAAAESLRVPTLLVRGGASDVLSPQDAARFLKLVPHSEFAEVSGAHHMVAGDDNVAFESVLGDFLDRRVRTRLDFIATYS